MLDRLRLARNGRGLTLLFGCAFLALSVFSYNPGDSPGSAASPPNSPPKNLCGPVGAFLAHLLMASVGWASLLVLFGLLVADFLSFRRRQVTEKAVRLAGKETLHQNTLGVAYYRAGRYREAVDVLRPNIDKEPEKYWAFDLYFLAMSYHRLGESERAKDYLAWAVRWSGENRGLQASQIEELKEFRVEAEELLNAKKGTSKEK